jgi:hypothetical protein
MQRRPDVDGLHRRGDPDRGGLVPAPGVERARDAALLVERVARLFEPARDQHETVELEEPRAIEHER